MLCHMRIRKCAASGQEFASDVSWGIPNYDSPYAPGSSSVLQQRLEI
jgi:hypothetical protein